MARVDRLPRGTARSGQTGPVTGARDDGRGWDASPPGAAPPGGDGRGYGSGATAYGAGAPPYGQGGPPPAYGPAPEPWAAAPQQPWAGQQGPWWTPPAVPLAWPKGPGRPAQGTAAAVLGFIAGGIAILWGLVGIVLLAGSDGGSATWVSVVVGLPAGAALIYGSIRLLAGTDRWFVVGGGAALALTVLLQAVVSAASSYGTASGQATLVVFLLPVPTVAAVLAALPLVGGWVASRRGTGPRQDSPQGW